VKEVDRHLFFFDKFKSFGIDNCLYEILKNDWVCHRSRSRCALLPHRHAGRLGKSWKHTTLWFREWAKSLQVLKRNSAYHSSDVYTVICAVVRKSQCVNKKPHKVWVAVYTDETILLSADMTVPYRIISLCVCDCQIYVKCMNTVVYLMHFLPKIWLI